MAALLAGLAMAAPCPGQCQYEVTIIQAEECPPYGYPPTTGVSLNESGHVVGYYPFCVIGSYVPFLWTPETGMIALPLPPGSYEAYAGDINDVGQIVGTMTVAGVGYRGFLYDNGEFTTLPPVIPDAGWSSASAINNDGVVVGYRSVSEDVNPYNAYIWSSDDGFTDLGLMNPYSRAVDISEGGVVAGWTGLLAATDEVFLWEQGEAQLLGPIPGGVTSSPGDLNNRNQVAGAGLVQVGRARENRWRAFLWDRGCWTLIAPLPGHDRNTARALNDLSQVVGQSGDLETAFLWQKGSTYDLNELALLDEGCTIERAQAINNAGVIIGDGDDAEWNVVTVVLTPIDRPAADIDADCRVDVADLLFLLGEWGKANSPADIDGDGVVDFFDLLALLRDWGS